MRKASGKSQKPNADRKFPVQLAAKLQPPLKNTSPVSRPKTAVRDTQPATLSPQLLLQHFDRVGDAPDAIPRLRRFILGLAVRGKLVEQEAALRFQECSTDTCSISFCRSLPAA